MKKALSIFSSVALTLATLAPVSADAQLAKKAVGSNLRTAQTTATQKAVKAPKKAVKGLGVKTLPKKTSSRNLGGRFKSAMSGNPFLSRGKKSPKALAADADVPTLYGSVVFNDLVGGTDGLYTIANGTTTQLFEGPMANYGGVEIDGIYYAIDYKDLWGFIQWVQIDAYDIETGEAVASNDDGEIDNLCPAGIAKDPTTGNLYAITYNADGDALQLATIDIAEDCTVTTTAIAPIAGNWNAVACAPDGQLYGISYTVENQVMTSSSLCKIDKATAAVTEVGVTGQIPYYLSSATIDPASGRMFWNVCSDDDSGVICEVNLTTGAATVLYQLEYNDEVMGMYIPFVPADNAPGVATDLKAEFADGALAGTISFTAPTTYYNGTTASGDLTYSILANGTEVAAGSTTFGGSVVADVEVAAPGLYKISVTTTNEAGTSQAAKLEVFVGNGTPAQTTATLVYADGKMNLTWTPVTTSADGGYINAEDVTYTVTRFPGGVTVAEDVQTTSFSEDYEDTGALQNVYYTVVATCAGISSEPAVSNSVTLGALTPPYSNSLSETGDLDDFTIIDANGDGKEWKIANGAAQMTYNSDKDMDDWMITPGLKLEAGKMYYVSFEARANGNTFPERFEAKWGAQASAAGMTNTIVAPTEIVGTDYNEYGAYITPETSGTYYIGIHGMSDADMYYLYVKNLSVSGATSKDAPAAVEDLKVTPDADGALSAVVSFTTPSLNLGGTTLSDITKAVVKRNGTEVKTFENPGVGAELSFTDSAIEAAGDVTYTVQCYNAEGEGPAVESTEYVGVKKPAAPTNVKLVEEGNTGKVTLSWDAVTTAFDGTPINASKISYVVCQPSGNAWAPMETVTDTEYTFQAVPEGEQDFVQYAVFAQTEGGSAGAGSDMIAAGKPYSEIMESFPDGTLSYIWGIGFTEGGQWAIYDDESIGDVQSMDADNGFAGMKGSYIDNTSGLFTGKVDLSGMTNPGVSFYNFNIVGESADLNEIQIYVLPAGAEEWVEVGDPVVVDDLNPGQTGWQLATVSLDAYKDQVVQVRFQATTKVYSYTFIDNIKVGSMLGNDLQARQISGPAFVTAGDEFEVSVDVFNAGTLNAGQFTVDLFADGTLAETQTVESLATGKIETVKFSYTMPALADKAIAFYAVVNYADDENADNNKTETFNVAPKESTLPKVTDLSAEEVSEGVKLTWSEPDLTAAPAQAALYDFEDADAFAMEYGGWTFVDVDQSEVGGFEGVDVPNITPGSTTASFFTFDNSGAQFNQSYNAHSGKMFLAALFRYDDEQTDDWAISPALSGDAQTVSFFARSYSASYPEKIEMYYSTGSLDTEDFVKVGNTVSSVPATWTEYTFDVPAGAKYFAIRSCATGSFMLMLDDFTFAAADSTPADLSIVGYDVYRDGVKITAVPVAENEYTDTEVEEGKTYNYVVITVYSEGYSAASNVANVTVSALGEFAASKVGVAASKGQVVVTGAAGKNLSIASADGKVMFAGVASDKETVQLPAAVYVVTVDKKAFKVVVR